ncbi:hypothetical protein AAZX31_01G069800 [Glycine max]|uniref:PHD-type zinc finger plants domain-containing protein n=2 Tax=Glycine subgen. Soja TaxID=1462606 RepID=I1J6F4_SOYBN|nr:uncharacterized protein LOC100797722 [Glycine max]XP_028232955.1 uncharacterized protein LOC114413006 [Glycine soja]KAG5059809.1 hypothetical protein JHK87_000838 [Glycine soja]KAG5068484.1 hypothetical protein JHK85_000861 [Glycine max]KAG5088218.1 hypothetical protein JHK86_000830 [Glycine max]KAH1162091.1 hypothetical protein GYH30_000817 [Glycine max]KAH1265128.1 hypothetical protein GmHk_01G000885 [Glycine max]|eukprot:XP_006573220.1 uncharacterized protein LOC100797722 [Glycine max]
MVDLQTVCCMCGDVGFPDKLFRCNKCRNRFQHSYCSNYYGELPDIELCDWCHSEEKNLRHIGSNSKKPVSAGNEAGATHRSEYSGEKMIKQHDHHREESGSEKGKSPTPSPRPGTRRYKLLKDVMC